jgi:hypothetical protein
MSGSLTLLLSLLCLPMTAELAEAQVIHPIPRKKIIEFGWDMPSPAYLRDHLRAMEKSPFDGVAIRLPDDAGGGCVFDVEKWGKATSSARERELKTLREVPRGETLTDNFITVYGTSTMNWFSDADWQKVLDNVRFCSRAAKAGHCLGICWDAEAYTGRNPWRYAAQPEYKQHTFADTCQMVRKRGSQFMQALQEEFPGLSFLALRLLSDFQDGSPFSQHLFPIRDPQKSAIALEDAWWGLHPAFINGLLEAAQPEITFTDGNEEAYYYTSAQEFYRVVHDLRQEALPLVAPENRTKYASQYQIGHALSIEYTMGLWAEAISFPNYLKKQALELTPAQRLQWFEHNAFYAFKTTDQYVWCYSEDMNWWTGKNLPPGIEEALRSAKRKYEAGEPLGFTVETILRDAQERLKAKEKAK